MIHVVGDLRQIVSNTRHLHDFLKLPYIARMRVVEGQLWVTFSSHGLVKFIINTH